MDRKEMAEASQEHLMDRKLLLDAVLSKFEADIRRARTTGWRMPAGSIGFQLEGVLDEMNDLTRELSRRDRGVAAPASQMDAGQKAVRAVEDVVSAGAHRVREVMGFSSAEKHGAAAGAGVEGSSSGVRGELDRVILSLRDAYVGEVDRQLKVSAHRWCVEGKPRLFRRYERWFRQCVVPLVVDEFVDHGVRLYVRLQQREASSEEVFRRLRRLEAEQLSAVPEKVAASIAEYLDADLEVSDEISAGSAGRWLDAALQSRRQ